MLEQLMEYFQPKQIWNLEKLLEIEKENHSLKIKRWT